MNWHDAVAWTASLTVGGVTGWRLPTMTTSSNEFGWLWHQLNGGAYITSATDISPFTNLPYQDGESSEWYWTGEESGQNAWRMSMNCACWDDGSNKLTAEWYAWAVHDGDVANVPETSALPLLATGLILLGIASRRQLHH